MNELPKRKRNYEEKLYPEDIAYLEQEEAFQHIPQRNADYDERLSEHDTFETAYEDPRDVENDIEDGSPSHHQSSGKRRNAGKRSSFKKGFFRKGSSKKEQPKEKKSKHRIRSFFTKILMICVLVISGLIGVAFLFPKTVNILVLGGDAREHEEGTGRADSIMLLQINVGSGEVTMFSVARDTYMPIECEDGKEDKITHALAYGGEACVETSLENYFNLKIDNYYMFSFKSFKDVVDEVGDIKVTSNGTFTESSDTLQQDGQLKAYTFEEGKEYTMNGDMALAYARHRHSDNDFKRGERQQQVLSAIMQQVTPLNSYSVTQNILSNSKTNFSIFESYWFTPLLFKKEKYISIKTEGQGDMSTGVYYYRLDPAKRNEVTEAYKKEKN